MWFWPQMIKLGYFIPYFVVNKDANSVLRYNDCYIDIVMLEVTRMVLKKKNV